jgi:hypothetical protein
MGWPRAVEHRLAQLLVDGSAVGGLGHAPLTAKVRVGSVGGNEGVGLQ